MRDEASSLHQKALNQGKKSFPEKDVVERRESLKLTGKTSFLVSLQLVALEAQSRNGKGLFLTVVETRT